jgi:uncharacterized DUF497 family protein
MERNRTQKMVENLLRKGVKFETVQKLFNASNVMMQRAKAEISK